MLILLYVCLWAVGYLGQNIAMGHIVLCDFLVLVVWVRVRGLSSGMVDDD